MKYCTHCQVYIREKAEKCTLCGNLLPSTDDSNIQEEIFPKIPPYYESKLAIRIMIFISIIAVVLSFAIDTMFPSSIRWPILLLFGLLSIWLGLIALLQRRYYMPKKIIRQVAIISLLAIFWDWETGWRGWSLDYVIPITCMSAMIIIYVIAKIMNISVRDYITYALIDGLFGIIPFLFMLFGWVNVVYPTIICVSLSIIFLSALFIFEGRDIRDELNKKMHI